MNRIKSTEQFIEKAKKMHGEYFDYSLVQYTGCTKKVKIICPVHGEFQQTAANHINGNGCEQCRKAGTKAHRVLKTEPKLFV